MMKDWKKYLAEMLGTMILVLVGLGATFGAAAAGAGDFAYLVGALGFGLALMAIIFIIGPISGGHVNPAVSLGFALRKKLSWKDFCFYVVSQIIGAIVGVLLIFLMVKLNTLGHGDLKGMGSMFQKPGLPFVNSMFAALLLDVVMTFVFVLTIMGVVRKVENKAVAAVALGLILLALVFTGAALNPAVALGSAIFGGVDVLKDVWLFILAPLVGGALAALVAHFLFKGEPKNEEKAKIAEPTSTSAKK